MAAPPQQSMEVEGRGAERTAYHALTEANLICNSYQVKSFEDLDLVRGTWNINSFMCLRCCCCPTFQCCGQLEFFVVDPGNVRRGVHGNGANLYFGPGAHVLCKCYYRSRGGQRRVSEERQIISGTKAIITVKQGFVALAFEKGEPVILPPGLHQWDSPDIFFREFIDLSADLIKLGPYTLVTVEECYSAITQDNGKQRVLHGGNAYMLTHQNWKFLAWLPQKVQVNKFGPLHMTTGDNIKLAVTANVSWYVLDADLAAASNVDTTTSKDTLGMIRDDVILQVTSALASLVGSIQYGSKGTATLQQATREGHVVEPSSATDMESVRLQVRGGGGGFGGGFGGDGGQKGGGGKGADDCKTGRQALWDPARLECAVNDSNAICSRYGVKIISITLVSVAPSDKKLVDTMSRGAIASVAAEESAKAARAEAGASLIAAKAEATVAQREADAMLIKVRSEAEAVRVAAEADADSERIRAKGSRDGGQVMGESEVAVSLAKLKLAYGPFEQNDASTFFFGLEGPGQLPSALLGNSLARSTGATAL